MQTTILLQYVVKWDIFHLGVEWGIVDFKIQAISSTLRSCKFSFLMIVGSRYVFHTNNDDDVLSHKINQHTCVSNCQKRNYVYPDPLLHERWYVGTKGSQLRRVKNHKKYISFLIPTIYFYIQHFIAKIHRFSKRFLWSTIEV